MEVLDTNHLSAFEAGNEAGGRLRERLSVYAKEPVTTVVCVQERIDGWLAEVRRFGKDPHRQIGAYQEFYKAVETYARWLVLPRDAEAADLFIKMRRQGIQIGTMDLKIACIVMVHDALLLTQNRADFVQVPGLRFEDWLE